MTPSCGRIVHYTLSAFDCESVNRRRVGSETPAGAQAHCGNTVREGEVVPLLIVRVWSPTCVNGQVLLDGNDSLWVTSASEGDGPGRWRWPERQP